MSTDETIETLATVLGTTQRWLFITGAGISADSGLPTYRGIGGLYDKENTDEGIPIEEALSGAMMRSRPDVTWKYIRQIESACRGARPNGGHHALAALERLRPESWVLTQNVDGFHLDAGSHNVIEIHGNLRQLYCPRCGWSEEVVSYAPLTESPSCPACGAPIRPTVVLFGEALPQRAVGRLLDELERGFDVVFSIGTSSLFPYIAEPVIRASQAGVPTVEINPEPTELSPLFDFGFREGATGVLQRLLETLEHKKP